MISEGPTPTGLDRIEQLSPGKLDQLFKRLQAKGGAAAEGIRPGARSAEGSPLSFSQERLWFLDELQPGGAVYNVPAAFRLQGLLDVAVLEHALGAIVRRHETLRTTFTVAGGRPVQRVAPEGRLAMPVIDLQALPSAAGEKETERLRAEEARRPFDLARGPLLRTALIGLAAGDDGDHVLLLTLHHIVADAWSLGVLIRELGDFYQALFRCRPPSLPELPVQYADYVLWQRQRLQGERLDDRLAYWQGRLAGLPVLELPTDHPRPAVQSGRGRRRPAVFPGAPLAGLQALADSEGATLFMVLLSAFELLLRRYTGQDDFAVGASVANREPAEVEPLIGFFVNTVVMRGTLREEETGREWLRQVRSTALAAYAHQELPFEKLVEELRPERSLDRNPLVQVLFSLQNAPLALELPGTGLSLTLLGTDNGTSKLDLNLMLWETPAGLAGEVEYSTDLFEAATIARLERHFETLLAGLAAAPDRPLADLSLLCPEERQQLLAEWNDTRTTTAPEGAPCLHRLFERQAERSPDAVAVACEGRELTYRALDGRADRLARRLRALGVGPEVPVAVAAERSLEAVVGLLAVLKAGGAYLPLDPSYPRERLALMLRDSRAPLLLAQPHLAAELPAGGARTVLLDGGAEEAGAALPGAEIAEPDSLAYVIYTSGSTGTPKGAMNTHRAVVNRILWSQRLYRLEPVDRVLQKTPFSFDISVWELFWPLLTGARLVLARPGGHKDSSYLADVIAEQGITTLHFVPSMLQVFLEEAGLPSPGPLRRVIASGEALTPAHRDRFLSRFDAALHNLYGPTEAAIEVTAWPCAGEGLRGTVPIGRPIDNVTIQLLDEALRPVPVGVPGQLHIGGMAPARGYLHRPDLTAERFVPDPFAASPGGRLYATGDLARHLPDGTVEYRGRIDHQHKLRGFRIELGEIEAALRGQPGVADAVAVVREDRSGDPRLVAYAVAAAGESPGLADRLRQALADRLPAPMVPSALVLLDALPLTPNGKVDRKALPAPDAAVKEDRGGEPGTPVQEMLAALWRELLGTEDVRLGDNFFELGGHSLKVTQLRSRVQSVFGLDLPLQSFFTAQTLALQAELAEAGLRQGVAAAPPIAAIPRDGDLPLSFAQQRLWFLDQLEPGTALYNVPLVGDLSGVVDVAALERSFVEIVRRHESLRTTFPETAAGAVQQVAPAGEVQVPLPVIDACGLPPAARARELERLTLAEARRPFDLARGPLLRTFLLRGGAREHVLLISMHHIITDGWSTGVIVRELSAFYHGFATGRLPSVPAPALQYADFAAWQRRWLTGDVLEEQMGYWRRQLAGLSVTELPTDRPRPAVEMFRGAHLPAALPAALTESMRALARGAGATLYMVLLAAFDALVASSTGRTDVAVGAAVANRNRRETEDVVGFFVNTLVMRTRLAGDPSLRELLGRVRETALAAYVHEDLPFEKIVEELQPQRDQSRNPLFQLMLVLQNAPLPPLDLPGLVMASRHLDLGVVKFDMAPVFWEEEGRLVGRLEYSTVLFDATTMRRLLGHYEALLARAVADPDLPISALTGPTEAERHQIVEEWNDSRAVFGRGGCIHQWVEEQVAATPEALALVAGDVRLSYRELNAMANRLAHHLRRRGIGADVLVGICVDRTWSMVVGLLGVLKAGGAALALDPTYPEERLRYVIQDAGLALLLAEEKLLPLLPDTGIPRLRIDTDWPRIAAESDADPAVWTDPESTMYLIYTSGSTGLPKGVSFPHRAFVNLLAWQFEHSQLAHRARTVQFATFGFCVSFLEIFAVLCSGSTLVMVPEEYRRDMEALWRHLEEHEVERLHLPFAALKQLADVCGEENRVPRRLREVVTSGEQLQVGRSIRSLFTHLEGCSLTNQYGTSEIHVVSSFRLPGQPAGWPDIVPVGRPVANSQIYLLDERMQPLPVGVLGELYAGGACLARGYLGAPAQTAAKFVPDPFAAHRGEAGARLYRTGDLARQLPDGRVEWFGRIDNQVRIRGFRVELGEVETAVKQHLGVRNAAVLCRPGPGGAPRLIAYVVPHDGAAVPDDLRSFLKAKLPEHMVPAVFVPMANLPLNANGKLDLESFPDPGKESGEASFVAPSGPVEEMIAQILARILNAPRVGAHDSFFELGGHSLLATQVANRIRRNFAIDLPLRALFEGPTVAELARAVVALEAKPGRSEKIARAFLKASSLSGAELEEKLRASRPQAPAPAQEILVPTPDSVVDLSDGERERMQRLREGLSVDPYTDFEGFVLQAKQVLSRLPERLQRTLREFGEKGNPDGVLLLKGWPQDPVLPPTPTRPDESTPKATFASELWLCVVAAAFGEPVGYRQEKGGSILQDLFPTPVNADKQSSESSSVLLAFHTELAFHPFRPDYVLLYGVRQDPYKEARTMFASIRRFFHLLSPADQETLFSSLFRTGIDYSFGNTRGERGTGPLVPVLYGDRQDPFLRYDLDLMVGQTQEACRVLEVVRDLVSQARRELVVEPGNLLVIDNRRCVHARSVFRATFDGRDRWLQRTAVVRDLDASVEDRIRGTRVIATDFSSYLTGMQEGSGVEAHD